MRPARALILLLSIVLLAPVTGLTGTASAAEDTTLTISGKPKVGVFHDDIGPSSTPDVVRHRGRLTTAGGEPVPDAAVQLERQLVGGALETLAGETDEDGRYEFFTSIEGNARYQVTYAGDVVNEPAESDVVSVKAMRDFNAELVEKPQVAVFKGNINPEWNNKTVQWQRKTCRSCAWKTIDQEKSGDKGRWSFRGAYPPVNKKWYYRATLDGTKEFVKSYSATLITTTTPLSGSRYARSPARRSAGTTGTAPASAMS